MSNSLAKYCHEHALQLLPEQERQWICSPTTRQIELEVEWGMLWRPAKCYVAFTTAAKEPAVADSVAATLAQRGSRYGDFTDHARLCQNLMGIMQTFEKPLQGQENLKEGDRVLYSPWTHLSPVQRQALTVIADKIARILSGDPNYNDNWHDIQGYAKLVEDRLPKESK